MKEERIFDIIIRSLQGDATAAELKAMDAWQNEKAENRKLVTDISKIWNDTRAVTIDTDKYNVDAAWEKISKRITEYEKQQVKVRTLYPSQRNWWLAAASVALLIVTS